MNRDPVSEPAFEGNFYHDGRVVGRVRSAVLLPLDRTRAAGEDVSQDSRARYLLTIDGKFSVHGGPVPGKFEVDSGPERIRVFPEDSQTVGTETTLTITLEG